MDDRYSRQTALPEVGANGQARLFSSTVAIVGAGGLGSAAAELLCRAGVGALIIVDYDVVELSNLQRQALFEEKDVGTPKAMAAAEHLKKMNSDVRIAPHVERIEPAALHILDDAEVVLDCTDNLETRRILNGYALEREVPAIFCSAQGMRGMLYVVDPRREGRACFSCIFGKREAFAAPATTGVLGATVRIAASLQTAEALKILLGEPYSEELISFDVWDPRLERFKVKRNPSCGACGREGKRKEGKGKSV